MDFENRNAEVKGYDLSFPHLHIRILNSIDLGSTLSQAHRPCKVRTVLEIVLPISPKLLHIGDPQEWCSTSDR